MLKKVIYASVLVSDQDEALDFYTNVIGFEARSDFQTPDGPRFLTIGIEGQDFDLVLWPGTPAKVEPGSAVYTLEVENCRGGIRYASGAWRDLRPARGTGVPLGICREVCRS